MRQQEQNGTAFLVILFHACMLHAPLEAIIVISSHLYMKN